MNLGEQLISIVDEGLGNSAGKLTWDAAELATIPASKGVSDRIGDRANLLTGPPRKP